MNYINRLEAVDNFFKVIPQNIGDIQYCSTTNPKAEKDSTKKRVIQYLLAIGIPILIITIVAVLSKSPIFITIVAVVSLFVIFKCIDKISSFEGMDFFVGSEGVVRLTFEEDRNNVKIMEEILFKDVADYTSKEVHRYQNRSYVGTEIEKTFWSEVNEQGERSVLGGWTGTISKEGVEYKFMQQAESAWSVYYLSKVQEQFANEHKISFNVYTDKGFINDYLVFEKETLQVSDRIYDKSTLKDVRLGNGVLIIEHVNHSTKLFGLIEKGNQEEIPIHMIANSKVFMMFFQDFYANVVNK